MSTDPTSFYTARKSHFEQVYSQLKRKSFTLSMLRLVVFLGIAFSIYFFIYNSIVLIPVIVVGVAFFLFLVARYTDVKKEQKYVSKLIEINDHELQGLEGVHTQFSGGEEFIHPDHHYNQDIDLFGEGSVFQRIDRTETDRGQRVLANWLNSNNIDRVPDKQNAIRELSRLVEWRQEFKATAALVETEISSAQVLSRIENHSSFVPAIFKWLPAVFTLLSLGVITSYALGFIPGTYLLYWLFVGLGISGIYVKRITTLYNSVSQMKDTFMQYAKLLEAIENQQVESALLKELQLAIQTDGIKASKVLQTLSKNIDYLGNRNNMIFAPIANGFFLWDLFFSYKIEQWLENFDASVHHWFNAIEHFDAYNSLGNYAYNNPAYSYPKLSEDQQQVMVAEQLAHPLLSADKVVKNDVSIRKEDFFIVTGANMAGKSTFLRTVAVNLVMANCGLPVSAKSFSYTPIKLISSMRTSDSLTNDESYFFSELKRLKFIVGEMKTNAYFIILDEILKGTNSKDKAEGSQKFVEKLVSSNSTGLIATHDLSLCTLEDKLPQVSNYYFDAEIVNDELYFDYTFKKGICQNMNASFLLNKMGIV